MLKSRYFYSGSIMAVAMAMGGHAMAQQATVEEVVVTGSFIRGTPEDAALPVDVIGSEELSKRGSPTTIDLIKSLPISGPILSDSNQFSTTAQGQVGGRIYDIYRVSASLSGEIGGFNCTGATPGQNGCQYFNPFRTATRAIPPWA